MVIYEIINIKNNKRYIGQTKRSLAVRVNEHRSALMRNLHANKKLQNAWNKYGQEAFQFNVIEKCRNMEDLAEREEYYVQLNIGGYNIKSGGNSPVHTEETKLKISRSRAGKPGGQLGSIRGPQPYQVRLNKSKRGGYPQLVTPLGDVVNITILNEFCRMYQLTQSAVRQVISKKIYQYKGWRLATGDTINLRFIDEQYSKNKNISLGVRSKGYPTLVSPDGDLFTIQDTMNKFCRHHNLSPGSISQLINGKKDIYKGWTVNTTIGEPRCQT